MSIYSQPLARGNGMSDVSLHDCYAQDTGRAFATGTQALVRLLLEQARRDRKSGLKTRGLVSGYPGSPLAGRITSLPAPNHFLMQTALSFNQR